MYIKTVPDSVFLLSSDKSAVRYKEEFTITLQAIGPNLKQGMRIPYRVLNSPSAHGSDIVLIDFTYNKEEDYYYLHVLLSEPLGVNKLEVIQTVGPIVALEKITDIMYRYKNPKDNETTDRTFRAILTSIASSDDDLTPGVRAFDFTYSNEYGFFELDENLRCVKTFKNNISHLNKIDRVFNISLYYLPQFFTTVLFINNYQPPLEHIKPPANLKPIIRVEAIKKSIFEGEDAEFKITYENIRRGYKLKYEYLDTKDKYSQTDLFVTDATNEFIVKIPAVALNLNTSQARYIKLWIKDYPKITDMVFVNVIPKEPFSGRFKPGEYTIEVPALTAYHFTLIAGGGAGGASVNNRQGNWNVDARGGNGGDTYVELDSARCTATGGVGGSDAHWHNGSSFTDGQPGVSLPNDIVGITGVFQVATNTQGKSAEFQRQGEAVGAPAITTLGDATYNGAGGNGGFGVGDLTLSAGGAGASGGMVVCTYRNGTTVTKKIKLVVGHGGEPYDLVRSNTAGKEGKAGEGGFAIVRSL